MKKRTPKQKLGAHIGAIRKLVDNHVKDYHIGCAINASLDRVSENFLYEPDHQKSK